MSRARLRETKLHLGTWLSIGSPVIAELAAASGFGWLLFDLEHGCGSEATLLTQLQAIRGTGAAAIVRVGAPHLDLIARVLDWGADGIMVPHVSSAAEAEACVRKAHYPPRGRRGYSRTVRATTYGLHPLDLSSPEAAPLIFAQIENIEGVEACAGIAAVPGIDVLFVGPADLRFDLEARPSLATRSYEDCLHHVAATAAAADRQCGLLLRDATELARHRALGFTQIAIESDLSLLRAGYQQIVSGETAKE